MASHTVSTVVSGFSLPERSAGISTLAALHAGQQQDFAHASFAFGTEQTESQVNAFQEKTRGEVMEKRVERGPYTLTLLSECTRFPLSKLLRIYERPNFVKLSILSFIFTPSQSFWGHATEAQATLYDERAAERVKLREVTFMSNTSIQKPLDTDFSVPRRDFKHLVLEIRQEKLTLKKGISWGEVRFHACIIFSNFPKMSEMINVGGKLLLPKDALKDYAQNPKYFDVRLGEAGRQGLMRVSETIADSTAVRRGAQLGVAKAGTVHGAEYRGSGDFRAEEFDEENLDVNDVEVMQAAKERVRAAEEMQSAKLAAMLRTDPTRSEGVCTPDEDRRQIQSRPLSPVHSVHHENLLQQLAVGIEAASIKSGFSAHVPAPPTPPRARRVGFSDETLMIPPNVGYPSKRII